MQSELTVWQSFLVSCSIRTPSTSCFAISRTIADGNGWYLREVRHPQRISDSARCLESSVQ